VTRPITPPTLAITVQTNQANLTIMGETNRHLHRAILARPAQLEHQCQFRQQQHRLAMERAATNATRFFRVTAQ